MLRGELFYFIESELKNNNFKHKKVTQAIMGKKIVPLKSLQQCVDEWKSSQSYEGWVGDSAKDEERLLKYYSSKEFRQLRKKQILQQRIGYLGEAQWRNYLRKKRHAYSDEYQKKSLLISLKSGIVYDLDPEDSICKELCTNLNKKVVGKSDLGWPKVERLFKKQGISA